MQVEVEEPVEPAAGCRDVCRENRFAHNLGLAWFQSRLKITPPPHAHTHSGRP